MESSISVIEVLFLESENVLLSSKNIIKVYARDQMKTIPVRNN